MRTDLMGCRLLSLLRLLHAGGPLSTCPTTSNFRCLWAPASLMERLFLISHSARSSAKLGHFWRNSNTSSRRKPEETEPSPWLTIKHVERQGLVKNACWEADAAVNRAHGFHVNVCSTKCRKCVGKENAWTKWYSLISSKTRPKSESLLGKDSRNCKASPLGQPKSDAWLFRKSRGLPSRESRILELIFPVGWKSGTRNRSSAPKHPRDHMSTAWL